MPPDLYDPHAHNRPSAWEEFKVVGKLLGGGIGLVASLALLAYGLLTWH